jgi:hypothetical protein
VDRELGWISAEVVNVAKDGEKRQISLVDERGKVTKTLQLVFHLLRFELTLGN